MLKRHSKLGVVIKIILLLIGSVVTAAGLEFFLIPNQIIDGGVIGISIMASYLFKWPIGLLIILLNAPFLVIAYKHIGKTFVLSTILATISLGFWVTIFHPIPGLTKDLFLAAIFGGIIIGVGVGIIIRTGGSLDGTEMAAIILDRKSGFSVGEIIMLMNLFILTCAGFVFSWEKAMYSLVAYFVAFKTIDITVRGLEETKGVIIVSDNYREITQAIVDRLGRGVTLLHGEAGQSGENKNPIYVVITRLEVAKLKAIVNDKDPDAFLSVHEVHEVMYANMRKKAIH